MRAITCAVAKPSNYGIALDHDLASWRRSRFPARPGGESNLRIVFRPFKDGIELLAFGYRDDPSIYHTAAQRVH